MIEEHISFLKVLVGCQTKLLTMREKHFLTTGTSPGNGTRKVWNGTKTYLTFLCGPSFDGLFCILLQSNYNTKLQTDIHFSCFSTLVLVRFQPSSFDFKICSLPPFWSLLLTFMMYQVLQLLFKVRKTTKEQLMAFEPGPPGHHESALSIRPRRPLTLKLNKFV